MARVKIFLASVFKESRNVTKDCSLSRAATTRDEFTSSNYSVQPIGSLWKHSDGKLLWHRPASRARLDPVGCTEGFGGMKPPAFQFYADDFVAGTVDMTTEEIGSYILLLCYQWNKGGIPDSDEDIARIARLPLQPAKPQPSLSQASAIIRLRNKFRKHSDGMLRNDRLEMERAKQYEFRKKQAKNAKIRGINPAKPQPSLSQASAKPDSLANPSSCSPSPMAPIGDGEGSALYAEIPSWEEFWSYAQSIGCHGEAFVRDKYHAADQQNWQWQRNWRAYVNRVKCWWEEKGRPMANTNGKSDNLPKETVPKSVRDKMDFDQLNKARIDSGLEPLPPRQFK